MDEKFILLPEVRSENCMDCSMDIQVNFQQSCSKKATTISIFHLHFGFRIFREIPNVPFPDAIT